MVEDLLGKDKKLYVAFIDLEKKSWYRIDRDAFWNFLNICDVVRQLLEGMKAFYK